MPATDPNSRRLCLIEKLLRLPDGRLEEVERALALVETPGDPPAARRARDSAVTPRDWSHGPLHRISEAGTYIVTAATLDKLHHFRGPERLDALEAALLNDLQKGGWQVEARAVFSNHYHFVAHAQKDSMPLDELLQELHRKTALDVNARDHALGRQVWFQYWDTQLTFETSYFARLCYVHQNPVKHGLVKVASQYRWCSAAWFERNATPAQVKTIYQMKTDRIRIEDDFEPV